jgi:hypothetical protein
MNEHYSLDTTGDNKSGQKRGLVEIDLMDLAKDIWHARYTICAALVLAFVFSLVSLAFAKKSFTATAVMSPAESSPQGAGASSIGQLAGAASMLGVNVGPVGGPSVFNKFKSLLTSQALAEELFKNDALKPTFFGPSWVPATRSWKRPTGLTFEAKDLLKGVLGLQQWKTPNAFQLQEDLQLHLGILPDKVTGYVRLSIQGTSAEQALFVLRAIVASTDSIIRRDAKTLAANRITYLNDALQQTTLQDQRQAMISVLSTQEKNIMMASTDKYYAIDLVDPPSASPIPTSPRPSATIMNSLLTVLFLIMIWAVVRGHFLVRSGSVRASRMDPSLDRAMRAWLRKRLKGSARPETLN